VNLLIIIGIDIGSTTSKCVLLKNGKEIVGSALVQAGVGTDGPDEACRILFEKSDISEYQVDYRIATGYGRARWKKADEAISELSAHALGSYFLFPEARTVIDIGGQDAKVIALNEKGQLQNFVMNDKCAAGTGRFLDVMAGILKIQVSELENLAAQSLNPVSISNTCTVFAESEVISQLAAGSSVNDVVAGICVSVAGRVAALARRVGVKEQVCMSGGVAINGGVRKAMEQILGVKIFCSPFAQMTGALGAALYAYHKIKL